MTISALRACHEASYLSAARSCQYGSSLSPETSYSSGGDTVSISGAASGMSAIAGKLNLNSILGFETETPGAVTIDELESHGMESLREFNATVTGLLSGKGIDTSSPIELGTASDGSVIVTNDSPGKAAIESFFKENPDMANEYRRIDNLLTLARAAKEASEFQKAYRVDPKAALERFDYLFKTDTKATIRISDKGPEVTYSTVPKGCG